eukprot:6298694-Amphidinium_carterae.2
MAIHRVDVNADATRRKNCMAVALYLPTVDGLISRNVCCDQVAAETQSPYDLEFCIQSEQKLSLIHI